ncbi:MAG TPA: polyphosphate kinase 2, partial [Thiolapillus brandeum]|nr:polyphosphate kinase 2 [Thiolapillus brandeum]
MNQQLIEVDGERITVQELIDRYHHALDAEKRLKKEARKALRRRRQEQALKPYQAELIRMQNYLEDT